MNIQELTALPVVDHSGQVCGVISLKDLLPLIYSVQCDIAVLDAVGDVVRETLIEAIAKDNEDLRVRDFMTESVETTTPLATIHEAARKMVDQSIHHLPVVDEKKNVVGMLSTLDVVRFVGYFDER